MKPLAAALVLALMTCASVQAQPIYRCGAEYSQTPCPGGKIVESSDPRSAAQRSEAIRVAAQDRRRAAALERERRSLEAASKPAKPTGFNGRPAPAEDMASGAERGKARKSSRARSAKNDTFMAVVPAKPKESKPK